jgi:TonB family protein
MPNLLSVAIPGGHPEWVSKPSGSDLGDALMRAGGSSGGRMTMTCIVTNDGHMSACKAVSEPPGRADLERAALSLAPKFRMSPTTLFGCPVGGSTVNIPIRIGFK